MANVLIVDDSAVNRRFLATLLSHHGHEVIEASDASEVLASAKMAAPDLIVADVLMPITDGYQLIRLLQQDPRTSDIPVVVYTAHYGGREKALSSGAAWFLTNAESNALPVVIQRVLSGERQSSNGDASTGPARADLPMS